MENRILKPISIKLDKGSGVVLEDTDSTEELSLIPGVVFGNEHYGFILITNNNGKQREIVYQTECRIDAVGIESGVLKVFEEGKRDCWRFDLKGNLEKSLYNAPVEEKQDLYGIVSDNHNMFLGEPIVKNPISLKIDRKVPERSVILSDDGEEADLPLYPGAMIGGEHYGFILVSDSDKGQKEVIYPTQNKIEAIGCDTCYCNIIKVYEQGKYFPWEFTNEGKLEKEASYNPYSRKDKKFVKEAFTTSIEESVGFNVKVRK